MAAAILIVEGDRQLAERLAGALNGTYDVAIVATGAAALYRLATCPPDAIVIDDRLPDMDGLECVSTIRTRWPTLPIVVTANDGGEVAAVEALRRGATDYVLRHDDFLANLAVVVGSALARIRVAGDRGGGHERDGTLKSYRGAELDAVPVIAESPAMRTVMNRVDEAARQRWPVLLEGESGTGKEHIARAIHSRSTYAASPFVILPCAALSANVVEAELGRALVPGATIYLGQVWELSLRLQDRLVRLLGSDERDMGRDVRVIAGTSDLCAADAARHRDLHAILGRMRIRLPPLRERREDILPLALHFIDRFGAPTPPTIDRAALQALVHRDWPGNVRQLANEIHRDVILAGPGGRIDPSLLSPSTIADENPVSLAECIRTFEAALHADHASLVPRRVRALEDVTFAPNGREGALSDDRLTASCGSETTFAMVLASRRHVAGRWYVELTLRFAPGARRPGDWTDAGIVVPASRRLVGYGARRTLGEELADGDIIGLAIDLDRRRLHVRKNGTWVDGSPDDRRSGIAIGYPRRRFVVAVSISRMAGSGASDAWTANFGAAPFAHSLPAGYRSYDRRQAPRSH